MHRAGKWQNLLLKLDLLNSKTHVCFSNDISVAEPWSFFSPLPSPLSFPLQSLSQSVCVRVCVCVSPSFSPPSKWNHHLYSGSKQKLPLFQTHIYSSSKFCTCYLLKIYLLSLPTVMTVDHDITSCHLDHHRSFLIHLPISTLHTGAQGPSYLTISLLYLKLSDGFPLTWGQTTNP